MEKLGTNKMYERSVNKHGLYYTHFYEMGTAKATQR